MKQVRLEQNGENSAPPLEEDTSGDLQAWTFSTEEVSAGVYRVRGKHVEGQSIEATGTDPDALLAKCRHDALP